MENTDNCIRYFLIMENIKVIGMHSNIYTNMIFIGMGVKVADLTRQYPKTLFILLNMRNFSWVTMNYPIYFFSFLSHTEYVKRESIVITLVKKMQILWGLALYFLITCIGTE